MNTIIELRKGQNATAEVFQQGELDIDPVVAERCEERLKVARTHMAAGFYHWLEAGKQFAAIKEELGSRKWAPWLRERDTSPTSADYLIQIAERFDPILPTVGRIDAPPLMIDMQAMRLLASPAAPPAAAEQAVERAATGEHITKTKAEEMVAKARVEAEKDALATAQKQLAEGDQWPRPGSSNRTAPGRNYRLPVAP